MTRLFLLILTLISIAQIVSGQTLGAPDPCDDGTQNTCMCETAPVQCTIEALDGFEYTMSDFQHPNDGPTPMCPGLTGTVSNNPTWFAFLSWCETLELEVCYDMCSGGGFTSGLQAAIYSDCSDLPGSLVTGACGTAGSGCNNNDCRTLNPTGMTVGDTYYFLVDGCNGAACDVEITVTGDCSLNDMPPWDQEIQGDELLCFPTGPVTYSVDDHTGAVNYYWFDDFADTNEATFNPFDSGTDLTSTSYTFPAPGVYEICVDVDNKPCIQPFASPEPLCKDITVLDGSADAGTITATTSPSCPNTEITYEATGFTDTDDFDQYIFLTDMDGEIIQWAQGSSDSYTFPNCGIFSVYSYNFYNGADPEYTLPEIGDDIDDTGLTYNDCGVDDCFCDLVELVIEWEDTSPPTFDDPPGDMTFDCLSEADAFGPLDITDDCLGSTTVDGIEEINGDNCDGGTVTRTWVAIDSCGNSATHVQTITINATDPPTFTNLPDDESLSCADLLDGEVPVDYTNNGVGDCLIAGTVLGTPDIQPDICGDVVIYTWIIPDTCGFDVTATQTVTIDPPLDIEFLDVPDDVTITCADLPFTPVNLDYTNNDIGDCFIEGTEDTPEIDGTLDICDDVITITWEVTDFCGRVFDTMQMVTLEDTEPPVFVDPPGPLTFDCFLDIPAAEDLVWTDNCDGTGMVPLDTQVDNGTDLCTAGVVERTWIYTDDCGLTVTHTQMITVNPPAPVVWTSTLPDDISVECNETVPPMEPLMYSNGTGDGCEEMGSIPGEETGGPLLICEDFLTRTWEHSDQCGNPIMHVQTITLIDVTPPELQDEPGNLTLDCYLDVPVMEDLVWTDNCDGTDSVEGVEAGTIDVCTGGTITRTWTYTDICGTNTDTHVQTIEVTPVPDATWITALPEDVTIECITDPLPDPIDLEWSNAPASTNCFETDFASPVDAGTFVNCGDQITRTWEVIPTCGPTLTYVQTFTFEDITPPEFTDPPADMTFDCYLDVPTMDDLVWTDNCDGTDSVPGVETGTIVDCVGGTIMRTWEYTDLCDNPVTHTQTITVTPVPDIIWLTALPEDITIECITDPLPDPIDLEYSNAPISANCLETDFAPPVDDGTFVNCGDQITRTWEVIPTCGPTLTYVQTFTFEDITPPEFTDPPADMTFDCYLDVPTMEDLVWTDNCDGTDSVPGVETGTIVDCVGGTIMRTWEYLDLCDNPATHTQTITVTPVPDIMWLTTLPADITIECITDPLPDPIDLEYSNAPVSANCLETDFISPIDAGAFVNCGDQITRTWEVIPTCGPTLTYVQTFTFEDITPPVFTSTPADMTFDCFLDLPLMEELEWTDNCDGTSTVAGTEMGTIDDCNGGVITRMWEYMDLCDNLVTHTQTITVNPVPDLAWISTLPGNVTIQCGDPIPPAEDLDYSNAPTGVACEEGSSISPEEAGELLICGDEIIRTWEVTSTLCGDVLTHVQVITLEDLTPPVFVNTPDAAIMISCLADLPAFDDLEWEDNCDLSGTVPGSESGSLDACTGGSITRMWMYSDVCGNGPAVFNQVITLVPPTPTACSDGDDCTIDDRETLDCEGNVCVPCAGVLTDCNGLTEFIACNDNDECTINDLREVACDGSFCGPCAGVVTDCSNGLTFDEPCSDGDPCTINDIRVIDCQGQECVPCMGTPNPTPVPTITAPFNACMDIPAELEASDCNGEVIWYDDAAGTNVIFIGDDFTTPPITGDIVYYVVCDVNDCLSEIVDVPLTAVDAETTTITGDDIICFGQVSELDAGNGFFMYDWGDGNDDQTLIINEDGTYTVTVTDFNACTSTDEFTVDVIEPEPAEISGSLTYCEGSSTTLTAETGFDSYLWFPSGEESNVLVVSTPDDITLQVIDQNGCQSITLLSVDESTSLEPQITGDLFICEGEEVTLSAGAGFDTYLWPEVGANVSQITVNTPGDYTVEVSDGSGCTGSSVVTVVQSDILAPTIAGDNPFCPGTDAVLDASDPNYTDYTWSNSSTNGSITVTTPDTYSVTVTDINGCTHISTIDLTEHIPPTVTITGDLNICDGEITTLTVDAGFLNYSWSDGVTTTNSLPVNSSGSYSVTVTDNNGCTGESSVIVVANNELEVFIDGGTTFCEGGSTTLDAGTWAGYSWLPFGENIQQITASTTDTYTVIVTDDNGCTGSSSIQVMQDDELSPTINGNENVCEGSTTTLSVFGTFTTYEWDTNEGTESIEVGAGDYSVTVTDASGCSGSSQITVTTTNAEQVTIDGETELCDGEIIDLTAVGTFSSYAWSNQLTSQSITINAEGEYSVTATDNNGCTSSTSVNVTVNTLASPNIVGPDILCEGSDAILSAGGPFTTYAWSTNEDTQDITINSGGSYTVTVTDAFGCEASSSVAINELPNPTVSILGSTTFCPDGFTILSLNSTFESVTWSPSNETLSEIMVDTEGTISVFVTDANGCTGSSSVEISEQLNLSLEILGSEELCEGSTSTLSVGSFITYEWSTNEDTQEITISEPGDYMVTVFDQSGCSGTADITVTEVESLNVEIAGDNNLCDGSSTTLSVPDIYTSYEWSTTNTGVNEILVNQSGTYTVTVTDNIGCEGSSSIVVVDVPNPSPMMAGDPQLCFGESTILSLENVYAEYLWSDGSSDPTLEVTEPGIISVEVTDINGCTGSTSVNTSYYGDPIAEISGSTSFCVDGSTTLDAGDGASWLWSTNEITQTISVSMEGLISVEVTDINGCVASSEIMVTEEEFLMPAITGDREFCDGESTILNAGDFATYLWSTNEVTQTIEVTTAGLYSVEVSDVGGCTGTNEVLVEVLPLPTPGINGEPQICLDGQTILTVDGDYEQYEWSNSEITQAITVNQTGNYSVIVTDTDGCTGATDVEVVLSPTPDVLALSLNCSDDDLTYTAEFTTSGDDIQAPPYSADINSGIVTISGIDINESLSITITDSSTSCDTTFVVNPPNCGCNASADAGANQLINCDIISVTLGGPGTATGTTFTYEWTDIDGNVVSTDPTYDTTEPGTFTLVVTDIINDCDDESSVTIDDERNEPLAIISADPDNVIDCVIDAVTLTSGASEENVIYTWINGKNITQAFEVVISEGGEVTLIALDTITGCSNESVINIQDQEEFPLLLIQEPDPLTCVNLAVVIDASQSQGSGSISYQWSDDAGELPGENTLQLEVTTPGLYYLEGTDSNNNCQNIDTIEVIELFQFPAVEAMGDPDLPCENPEVTLSAIIDNGGAATTIAWSTTDGNILSANDAANIVATLAGTYTVEVTDVLTGCVTSDMFVVNPNGGPSEVASEITDPSCENLTAGEILLETLAGGQPPYTYSVDNMENTTGVFTGLSGGSYLVEVTDALGCAFLTTIVLEEPQTVTLEVDEPVVEVEFGDDVTVNLTTNIPTGDIESIVWSPELPIPCPLCLTVDFEDVLVGQLYEITITNSEGCMATATVRFLVDREEDIFIPNIILVGDDDTFYPQSGSEDIITDEMSIYDRWGNLVYINTNFQTNDPTAGWDLTFNGQRIEAGVYVYLFVFDVPGLGKITKAGDITVIY